MEGGLQSVAVHHRVVELRARAVARDGTLVRVNSTERRSISTLSLCRACSIGVGIVACNEFREPTANSRRHLVHGWSGEELASRSRSLWGLRQECIEADELLCKSLVVVSTRLGCRANGSIDVTAIALCFLLQTVRSKLLTMHKLVCLQMRDIACNGRGSGQRRGVFVNLRQHDRIEICIALGVIGSEKHKRGFRVVSTGMLCGLSSEETARVSSLRSSIAGEKLSKGNERLYVERCTIACNQRQSLPPLV